MSESLEYKLFIDICANRLRFALNLEAALWNCCLREQPNLSRLQMFMRYSFELFFAHVNTSLVISSQYVELYAKMLLLEPVRASLDALRSGFLEAVPAVLLPKLTAEDFRLLLNGSPSVDIAVLKQRTHVSGDSRSTS